jgi:hypothetical protein
MNELPGYQLPTVRNGNLRVSQSYVETPEAATWKRRKHTAIAGQVTFFDTEITTEKRIRAGDYYVINENDVPADDYIEFSIIDKNDVLGLFETYGLIEGIDILEIHKFVKTEYIHDSQGYIFDAWCTEELVTGLFFRVAYNSSGTTDINFLIRILYFE